MPDNTSEIQQAPFLIWSRTSGVYVVCVPELGILREGNDVATLVLQVDKDRADILAKFDHAGLSHILAASTAPKHKRDIGGVEFHAAAPRASKSWITIAALVLGGLILIQQVSLVSYSAVSDKVYKFTNDMASVKGARWEIFIGNLERLGTYYKQAEQAFLRGYDASPDPAGPSSDFAR